MSQTEVRDIIADIIKREGVEYVFGHTGGHIRQLWHALEQRKLNLIFNKIEGNGVFAAMGHYQQSGKVGVAIGTSGPGVQNMVTATASAHLDSIPMVIIGAAVPTMIGGKNALQDSSGRGRSVEQRLIFKACTKAAMTVMTPDNAPAVFREAFRIAQSGDPGPVFIEVPSNYWRMKVEYEPQQPAQYKNLNKVLPDMKGVTEVMKAFYQAKSPVIVIGEGAAVDKDVQEKLSSFLKKIGVPYAVSPLTKDLVNERDPLCIGALRSTGVDRIMYQYLKQSDFVLSLGNRFEQWEWNWAANKLEVLQHAQIAQIDYDSDEIGRVYPADYSVLSNICSFIDSFTAQKHPSSSTQLKKLKALQATLKSNFKDTKDGIHPVNLIKISQAILPNDTCIVSDTGNIGSQVITRFKTSAKQRFLHAQRNSPMGYGVPASLGAALNHKGPVVCFVGDGSFNMTGNELGLLLNYDLKVIFIIANDNSCSMIKDGNLSEFGANCMTEFENPDYVKLAEAYGLMGISASNSQEFKIALQSALRSKKSVVIDARVTYPKDAWVE